MPFRFGDDTFFGPQLDRIISNQEDQHTIQIISFPGRKILWRYGHVNQQGSSPGYLRTPDDAYLLPNGLVTVADAYNCRVLFINRAHKIVRQYGTTGVCRHNPPAELGAVNGATPLPDGGTLVSEINGSWVDNIGANGRLRWAVQAPVSYPSDPQLLGPGRILLADYARPGHAIIMTPAGRVLWRYGPASGPGALNHPSLATLIDPGLIAINDDFRHRVVIVSIKTHHIVWQYGHTDQAGRAPGYLNTPDGLDLLKTADAQRLPGVRALLRARTPRPTTPSTAASPLQSSLTGYRLPAPVQRAVAGWFGVRDHHRGRPRCRRCLDERRVPSRPVVRTSRPPRHGSRTVSRCGRSLAWEAALRVWRRVEPEQLLRSVVRSRGATGSGRCASPEATLRRRRSNRRGNDVSRGWLRRPRSAS